MNSWQDLRRKTTSSTYSIISVDVFDTLLLRTTRPELLRFEDVTRLQHAFLRTMVHHPLPSIASLYEARLRAGRTVYGRVAGSKGLDEAHFNDILGLTCALTGLPPECIPHLRHIELAYERKMLQPNRSLLGLLTEAKANGKRIILASDMYLGADDLRQLCDGLLGTFRCHRLYVSSEFKRTKRHGTLFQAILDEEGVPPGSLLHLGDNHLADVAMPATLGIDSVHLPRAWSWRILHHFRARMNRRNLQRRNLIPSSSSLPVPSAPSAIK